MSVASCLTHGEGVLFRASASLIMRCSPTLLPLMDFWMSRLGLASKLPVDDEAASPTSPVHSEALPWKMVVREKEAMNFVFLGVKSRTARSKHWPADVSKR
ncbi:hypothetical protein Ac2012v2_001141 [Leucoagaricus gongylophorus]